MRESLTVRVGADVSGYMKAMSSVGNMAKATAKVVGAAAVGIAVASARIGAKFENELLTTATIANATGKEFKALENRARELGSTTAFTATQVAKGMYDLASAGMNTAQIIHSVDDALKLAGATGVEVHQTTYLLASTMKQFGLEAKEAQRIVDTYSAAITNSLLTVPKLSEAMKYAGTTGAALGWSLEETTAAVAMFTNLGLEGSMAGTNLRMSMLSLAKGAGASKKALDELGMTMEDVNPEAMAFGEVLRGLANHTMSATQAAAIFGTRAGLNVKQLAQLVKEGKLDFEGFVEMLKEAQKGVGRTAIMYERMMGSLLNKFKIVVSAIAEVMLSIFDLYKNEGKDLMDVLAEKIQNLGKWIKQNADEIRELAKVIGVTIKIAVGGAGLFLIEKALITITAATGLATAAMYKFNMSILTANASAAIFSGTIATIKSSFGLLFSAFAGWQIGSYLYDQFEVARLAGLALVDGLVKGWIHFKYAFKQIVLAIEHLWKGTIAKLKELWVEFLEIVANSLEKIPVLKKAAEPLHYSVEQLKKGIKITSNYNEEVKELTEAKDKELKAHNKIIDSIRKEHQGIKDVNKDLDKQADIIKKVDKALKEFFKDIDKTEKAYSKEDKKIRSVDKTLEDFFEDLDKYADSVDIFLDMMDEIPQNIKTLDEMSKEWEHFYERIEDITADSLFKIFDGQLDSWKDFLDEMEDLFLKTLSQMIAQAASKQIIVPIITSVIGATGLGSIFPSLLGGGSGTGGIPTRGGSGTGGIPTTGLGNTISTFMKGNIFGTSNTWGNMFGSSGLGSLGYSTIGDWIGLPQGGYSGIGSAFGGAAGSFFGPLGTGIGSILGGSIGSLFGGSSHKPHLQASTGIGYDQGEGLFDFDVDTWSKLRGSGDINEAEKALEDTLKSIAGSAVNNVNSIINQIESWGLEANEKALSRIDFDYFIGYHTTHVKEAIESIINNVTKGVNKFTKKALKILQDQYNQVLREQLILQIGGTNAPIDLQLKAINVQYDEYRRQLESLNATVAELTWLEEQRTNAIADATVITENSISAWEGMAKSLEDQIYNLTTGNLSPLSLTEQMDYIRANIGAIYGKDSLTSDDITSLQGLYGDLLGVGKQIYSPVDTGQIWRDESIISGQYQVLFDDTLSALQGLQSLIADQPEVLEIHVHSYIDGEEVGYTIADQLDTNGVLIAKLRSFL